MIFIKSVESIIENKISDEILKKAIDHILQISSLYPIYGSSNQEIAQEKLRKFLIELGWETKLDQFFFEDIESINKNFPHEYNSKLYSNYPAEKKTNLYGILDSGKKGPTIILNGHIDVDIVDSDKETSYFHPHIFDGKIFGRGTTDMLSGLVCLALIPILLRQIDWTGKIIFMSVVDEEISGNGSLRAFEYFEKCGINFSNASLIIAEPTDSNMCNACYGFFPIEITIFSKLMHMTQINQSNLDFFFDFYTAINSKKNIVFNVGKINGGLDASLPIERLDIGAVIATKPAINWNEIDEVINFFSSKQFLVKYPNFKLKEKKFIPTFQGVKYQPSTFPSACDLSVIGDFVKEAIIFGPGSLEQAHSRDEFISIAAIKKYLNNLFYLMYRVYNYD